MKKRLLALMLCLAVISGGSPIAHAADLKRSDDGGLHIRVLPVLAGALWGGALTVIVAPMIFPALAAAAGSSPFVQPMVIGRALLGLGVGGFLGDYYFP